MKKEGNRAVGPTRELNLNGNKIIRKQTNDNRMIPGEKIDTMHVRFPSTNNKYKNFNFLGFLGFTSFS